MGGGLIAATHMLNHSLPWCVVLFLTSGFRRVPLPSLTVLWFASPLLPPTCPPTATPRTLPSVWCGAPSTQPAQVRAVQLPPRHVPYQPTTARILAAADLDSRTVVQTCPKGICHAAPARSWLA